MLISRCKLQIASDSDHSYDDSELTSAIKSEVRIEDIEQGSQTHSSRLNFGT